MSRFKQYYEFMAGSLGEIPLDIEGMSAEEFLKKQGHFDSPDNLITKRTDFKGNVQVINPLGGNIVVIPLNK